MTLVGRAISFVIRPAYRSWQFVFAKQHQRLILSIAAVVAAPSALLRSYQSLTIDFSLVLFIASLYCVLSIIYFCHNYDMARKFTVAQTYTAGSGRFLQLLGVSLMQAMSIIPALGGITLALFVVSVGMSSLLFIPAVLLVFTTILLLVRLCLAPFIATCEGVGIWKSMRESARRTKDRRLQIGARYAAILLFILFATVAIFAVINLSTFLAQSWMVQGVASAILVTITLPWFVVFGYSIYDETDPAHGKATT